ncbi:DUF1214 domain-containing protein [Rhizobiaceae bacterium BDR2-2]|uniref:DUF1214 domain-containing protein n=1 Tax=Ectorhizobium quercum TaxID=2965071 RepID=A0AAE3N1K5_9HYPH|nr:DUF1214 domain-containing protein [Ectorhizobium quercum]MCX8998481.1 DUF1214 domain-containing protein [Ectorhizobium quercum]
MLKTPLMVAIALVIAFAGGLWSALATLDATSGLSAIRIGPWEAFPAAQTVNADPYARAHRARDGKLLYASAEGLSFTARTDAAGAPLDAACTYRLAGMAPPARLWTLFAAPQPDAPSVPAGRPTGLNSRMILKEADGSFAITLSAAARPGNWLALPASGRFTLVFDLFDTPAANSTGISGVPMPELTRLECGDD